LVCTPSKSARQQLGRWCFCKVKHLNSYASRSVCDQTTSTNQHRTSTIVYRSPAAAQCGLVCCVCCTAVARVSMVICCCLLQVAYGTCSVLTPDTGEAYGIIWTPTDPEDAQKLPLQKGPKPDCYWYKVGPKELSACMSMSIHALAGEQWLSRRLQQQLFLLHNDRQCWACLAFAVHGDAQMN
jgi:hypothetical protein